MEPVTLIGAPASPYVRKVMAVLMLKGVPFRLDPLVPFFGNDEFSRLSPLRRVPVLVDGDLVLPDSTAICEYLDEAHPAVALMPRSVVDRARLRWVEEYADTRLGEVVVNGIFGTAVIRPGVFKEARDEAALAKLVGEALPPVMDYLESIAPGAGFLAGGLCIADLAVATHFANLRWARTGADLSRWPRAAAWIERVEGTEPLVRLNALGERFLTTRIAERPALFAEFGIALVSESVAAKEARRSFL